MQTVLGNPQERSAGWKLIGEHVMMVGKHKFSITGKRIKKEMTKPGGIKYVLNINSY